MSMDRWQGTVGQPCGQGYRGGAGGVSGGNRRQVRIYSSRRNHHKRDFDCDKLASAALSGIASLRKKLPTAQVEDIRAFLNSLEETEDSQNCCIRYLIPSFVRQRICMKSGYAGPSVRISDEDLLDCLHICGFPKRELVGIAEESLRSAVLVRLLLLLMLQTWRGSLGLFDAMCKFVAEAGSTDFFS